MTQRTCACRFCGREHDGSYWWAQYCSQECRYKAEQPEFLHQITDPERRLPAQVTSTVTEPVRTAILNGSKPSDKPSAPVLDLGPAKPAERKYAPMREGERRLDEKGYVKVKVAGEIRPEHRIVMEQSLGRPLRKGVESVHHRNGIRSDNRPENLELWVGPIRYGQRATEVHCPACGVSYAEAVGAVEALLNT